MNQAAVPTSDNVMSEAFQSAELTSPKEVNLAARSDMYALLADLFRYPDQEFQGFVRSGELESSFVHISEKLPFTFNVKADARAKLKLFQDLGEDDVDAGFIRVFEAGPGEPPCALVEGKHAKGADRRAIFEDLIRFYNHFGLSYAEGSNEDRPDHISYELEFMHYLAFLTLRAEQTQKETRQYMAAQHDFLEHHIARWAGSIARRLQDIAAEVEEKDTVVVFYKNVAALLAEYIEGDFQYLKEVLE